MIKLRMVKYGKHRYPATIPLSIEEVAGHFDIRALKPKMNYSLHTEYSFTNRKWLYEPATRFPVLCAANHKEIPQLWYSTEWAQEFAEFAIELVGDNQDPSIIEIHPPFEDYCPDIQTFLNRYQIFEKIIKSRFHDVKIMIENRSGSRYGKSAFLFSKVDSLISLSKEIDRSGSDLRITLDIPQVYTAHNVKQNSSDRIVSLLHQLKGIRHNISGIHLWGKKENENGRRSAHSGDLNTYFYHDIMLKDNFLKALHSLLDDEVVRVLVLEVNGSNEDLHSIIKDLDTISVQYVS